MSPAVELLQAIRARQTVNPKTVLGFFGTGIGLVLAGCVSAALVLSRNQSLTYVGTLRFLTTFLPRLIIVANP
jgi:hypothetical protein